MKKFVSFFIGILTGALVGGSLALLLTPAKGAEIRSRIRDCFMNIRDEVNQAAAMKTETLKQELARLQNKLEK